MKEFGFGGVLIFLAVSGCSYVDVAANHKAWSKIEEQFDYAPGIRRVVSVSSVEIASPFSWFQPMHSRMIFARPIPGGTGGFIEYEFDEYNRDGIANIVEVDCKAGRKSKSRATKNLEDESFWNDPVYEEMGQDDLLSWENKEYCETNWDAEREAIWGL